MNIPVNIPITKFLMVFKIVTRAFSATFMLRV